jgi:hypothetical protein
LWLLPWALVQQAAAEKHLLMLQSLLRWNLLVVQWNLLVVQWNLLVVQWSLLVTQWNLLVVQWSLQQLLRFNSTHGNLRCKKKVQVVSSSAVGATANNRFMLIPELALVTSANFFHLVGSAPPIV